MSMYIFIEVSLCLNSYNVYNVISHCDISVSLTIRHTCNIVYTRALLSIIIIETISNSALISDTDLIQKSCCICLMRRKGMISLSSVEFNHFPMNYSGKNFPRPVKKNTLHFGAVSDREM